MENSIQHTTVEGFTIRNAQRDDIPLILQFIKELADYEKLSGQVVATEELLERHLFGENALAEVLIGEFEEQPAGFALFFHNFSTFLGRPGIYLEDLFVREEMRGRGFGSTMLSYLAKLAVERGCGRLEWSVLDWNEPAIAFYEKLGARSMDGWTVYRLKGAGLQEVADSF